MTDLERLRLYVGDTSLTYQMYTDNELNAIITRFTDGGTFKLRQAVGWVLRALSTDPDRLMQMKDATSGGITLAEEMAQIAQVAEDYLE